MRREQHKNEEKGQMQLSDKGTLLTEACEAERDEEKWKVEVGCTMIYFAFKHQALYV